MDKIPVIFDTDIGDDIDDTWALTMLLKSPELDVKMVIGDYKKPVYRAKILAKMLEVAGRTDIPVGVGTGEGDSGGQSEWVNDYDLSKYPGKVYQDGVGAMVDIIMNSPKPITLICTGPLPNIPMALEREPEIVKKARFVGMHGSVRKGYNSSKDISPEWNVKAMPDACRKAFNADWSVTITPLDTCDLIHLLGEKYKKVYECKEPLTQALIENYAIWCKASKNPDLVKTRSTTLFDTVAVYLAFSEELTVMEEIGIRVTDDGFTLIDPEAKKIRCAMEWKDLSAYEDFLVERLIGKVC